MSAQTLLQEGSAASVIPTQTTASPPLSIFAFQIMWQMFRALLLLESVNGHKDACRSEEVSMLQAAAVQTQAALTESQMSPRQAQARNVSTGTCDQRMTFETSVRTFPLQNLYWLHVPKTGTSFLATVWNYACGQGKEMLDITVSDSYAPGCAPCYGRALMERYPQDEYCTEGVLHSKFTLYHAPISVERIQATGMHVVAMFRQPTQRLISAHKDHNRAPEFSISERDVLQKACANESAECFARYPGIAGCMTRMLSGRTCTELSHVRGSNPFDGGRAFVGKAKEAVAQLAFVGLTERWNESVCLFHRMFGGSINPGEFMNFHHHQGHDGSDMYEDELNGFRDAADEEVYAAAQRRFESLLEEHVPAGESACDGLAQISQAGCGCETLRQQCGSVPGAGLDCGRCPKTRLAFLGEERSELSSVDVHCSAGSCKATDRQLPADLFDWSPVNFLKQSRA